MFPVILYGSVLHFFSLPGVFLSKHLETSYQKEGQNCLMPRSRSIMIFCSMSQDWLFTVGATCLPKACGAALPQEVVLGLHRLTLEHACTVLQRKCQGAHFQRDWAKPVASSSLPMTASYNYDT